MRVPRVPIVVAVAEWIAPTELGDKKRARLVWSDSSTSEIGWFDDEIWVCEGDLVGRSAAQIRSTLFHRDRDHLRSGLNEQ